MEDLVKIRKQAMANLDSNRRDSFIDRVRNSMSKDEKSHIS